MSDACCKTCRCFHHVGGQGGGDTCRREPPVPGTSNGRPLVSLNDWCSHWAPIEEPGPPEAAQIAREVGRLLREDEDAVARALQRVIAGEARRLERGLYTMPVREPRGDEPRCLSAESDDVLEEQLVIPGPDDALLPRWCENADKFIEELLRRNG